MQKLISLSLFIPLVSFGQLTLETMSNINDSQSFKRVMIENGFEDVDGGKEKTLRYQKMGFGEAPEIVGVYQTKDEDDIFFDERMMFLYLEDYKGENGSHQAIYDKVKDECEFVEVREYASQDVAFYKCQYVKPSKELLELQASLKKVLDNPNINILDYEVGFNKREMFHLIHFPVTDKLNSTYVNVLKKLIEKQQSEKLESND